MTHANPDQYPYCGAILSSRFDVRQHLTLKVCRSENHLTTGELAMNVRTETKKQQDEAYKKGKERREHLEKGDDPKTPKDDGYQDMTEEEKDAYKKGYRGD
jgi:hypothetical protein